MRACDFPAVAAAALALAAGCDSTPTKPSQPPPAACSYQVAATGTAAGFEGGRTTITVTTGPSCAWSARADASWLTIESAGTGQGTVVVLIAVSGYTVRVVQGGS